MSYQPKSYRKFLATSVAAAAVVSVVAAPAAADVKFSDVSESYFAATEIYSLVEKEIISGYPDGTFKPGDHINRGQAATLLVKAAGLEIPTSVDAAPFSDVSAVNNFAPVLSVMKEAGFINGYTDGTYRAGATITREQMATILVNTFGLENTGEEVAVKDLAAAHASHRDNVEILAQHGITNVETFNPKNNVTRAQFATFVYRALANEVRAELGLTGVTFVDNTTVEVNFDKELSAEDVAALEFAFSPELEVVSQELKAAEVSSSATGSTVVLTTAEQVEGTTYALSVNGETTGLTGVGVAKEEVSELAVQSVSAITANSVEVTFNQAVDPEKAKFALKRGAVSVNVSDVTFKEDNKTAVVELSTKFVEADYELTISGLTEEAFVAKFSTEAEKVAEIKILGDTVAATYNGTDIVGGTIAYRVHNQYGEDVTDASLASGLDWTVTGGRAIDRDNGVLVIDQANYRLDQTLTITGVERNSGTVVTKSVKVGEAAKVDTVNVKGLYNADDKELNTESTYEDFYLLVDAKDQYDNKITNVRDLNDDLIVTSSNPSVVNVDASTPFLANVGEDSDEFGIQLVRPNNAMAGTATIRIISKSTGKVVTYNVTVAEAAKVDTITLSQPTKVVATGETVQIPFEAFDQYGDKVTRFASLANGDNAVRLSSTAGNEAVTWKNDYVNRQGVIEFKAPDAKGTYVITAITSTGKTSQLTVRVEEGKTPAVVSQLKDTTTTLVDGSTTTLKAKNIVVSDQHGREYKAADLFENNYKLKVEVKDNNADVANLGGGTTVTFDDIDDEVVINGIKRGNERLVVSILDEENAKINSSEYEFTLRVVDRSDVTDFTVTEEVKEVSNTRTSKVDFKVEGLLANGTKVALPANMYSVTGENFTFDKGTQKLELTTAFDSDDSRFSSNKLTVPVAINIESADGLVTLTKNVTVSKEATRIVEVITKENDDIKIKNGVAEVPSNLLTADGLKSIFKTKDQFGTEASVAGSSTLFVSNVRDDNDSSKRTADFVTSNGTASPVLDGFENGYTFTVAVTQNGITKSIPVVVIDAIELDAPAGDENGTDDEIETGDENVFVNNVVTSRVVTTPGSEGVEEEVTVTISLAGEDTTANEGTVTFTFTSLLADEVVEIDLELTGNEDAATVADLLVGALQLHADEADFLYDIVLTNGETVITFTAKTAGVVTDTLEVSVEEATVTE